MFLRNWYRCQRCGYQWNDVWPTALEDACPQCQTARVKPYLSEETELAKPLSIAVLNDAFRKTFSGGNVVITSGVNELPETEKAEALQTVSRFDIFTEDNDPYEEHDFGIFELQGRTLYWKIDYLDPSLEFGSEDPADPSKTTRVLTIMLASEY